ncbi:a-factor receptor [Marasmius sp. AFHP31]|nr:a-factor receptor [Marasmius sp. AFHP31]
MIWTGLADLVYFVNSIIWNGRFGNYAPVWCDISAKYYVGINAALPACSMCMNRRLYHIVSTITFTRAQKRRAVMVDLAICIGIPVLAMILHYIPQGHRFNILEDVGCYPTIYKTWVAVVLYSGWPLVIACVSGVYSILCLRSFYKRRKQLKELLSENNNLNTSLYTRLMCLASADVIVTIPFALYFFIDEATGVYPWISWEDTHHNFSRVAQYSALIWKTQQEDYAGVEITRWAVVMCSLLFFAFFGFAEEARRNYRAAITYIMKRIGITSTGSMGATLKRFGIGTSMTSAGSFRNPPVFTQRETLGSFTDNVLVSSPGKESEQNPFGEASGAPLFLLDVGGTSTVPGPPSLSALTTNLAPFIASQKDDNEDLGIEISSSRYSITIPDAAHVRKDSPDMV